MTSKTKLFAFGIPVDQRVADAFFQAKKNNQDAVTAAIASAKNLNWTSSAIRALVEELDRQSWGVTPR